MTDLEPCPFCDHGAVMVKSRDRHPSQQAPGHTDLMVSPEAIDEFLAVGDHPEITPPSQQAGMEVLKDAIDNLADEVRACSRDENGGAEMADEYIGDFLTVKDARLILAALKPEAKE